MEVRKMNNEELKKITDSIKTKLGDDVNATIGDDIASLFTMNQTTVDTISKLQSELKDVKNRNELLVNANSRLLQQVPAVLDNTNDNRKSSENESDEKLKSFNFMDAFDEKGNFKKKF